MRFEQSLKRSIYPPWTSQYIDYPNLKRLLKDRSSEADSPIEDDDQWTEDDEGAFVEELVNVQLEKVAAFQSQTVQQLRDRTSKCEAKLDPIIVAEQNEQDAQSSSAGSPKPPVAGQITLQESLNELDSITKEMNELEKYSRINYTGFMKATKKHDRRRGDRYRVKPLMQVRLAELPFNKEDYSPLLYRLSTMYNFIRTRLHGRDGRAAAAENQITNEDSISHKFWVHPDNLLELRTMIMRRLPVLVYNPQTSKVAEGVSKDPTITSIYFDNPTFDLYNAKVLHDQSASSLRLRWYGGLSDKPMTYCEKKTVHQDDTSTEQKFTTKPKHIQPFLAGGYKMEKDVQKLKAKFGEESDQAQALQDQVDEIHSFVQEYQLQPVLRANYTRTAFQMPNDTRVRITLDQNLALIREDSLDTERPCREPDDWHRKDIDDPVRPMEWPFETLHTNEIARFPWAVLEIQIRGDKQYEWLQELMNSHLVKAAPRFSKFVQGIGTLFDDYVNQFPFWLNEVDTDIRKDPHQAFEEEQQRQQQIANEDFAVGSLMKALSPGMEPRGKMLAGSPIPKSRMQESTPKATAEDTRTMPNTKRTKHELTAAPSIESMQPLPGPRHSGRLGFITKYAKFRKSKGVDLPPGVEKPAFWIKDEGPVKVEAKVWLANQRTFIKWQHVGILMTTLSLGLFNAAGQDNDIARLLGLVYTIIGVLTAVWGYGMYIYRSRLIHQRSGKDFDNIIGPVVVCIALALALVLNFYLRYHAVVDNRKQRALPVPASRYIAINDTVSYSDEL